MTHIEKPSMWQAGNSLTSRRESGLESGWFGEQQAAVLAKGQEPLGSVSQ